MKTHAIEWNGMESPKSPATINTAANLNRVTSLARRAVLAGVPALVLIIGAAWLVNMPNLVVYLQAALWTSSFLFFGLALDSGKAVTGLSLATGFTLPLLAVLSDKVAVEISVVAVAVVAAWIAAAIWKSASPRPAAPDHPVLIS